MRNGRTYLDYGAQRAEKRHVGQRQEIGQRGLHAPAAGGKIVPEFVHGQDRQQRGGKGNAFDEMHQRAKRDEWVNALLHGPCRHHGQERQHKEDAVHPDPRWLVGR